MRERVGPRVQAQVCRIWASVALEQGQEGQGQGQGLEAGPRVAVVERVQWASLGRGGVPALAAVEDSDTQTAVGPSTF